MLIYCVSDIHSFYTPLKKALDEKGFQENSEDHLLVVLGDVFDRGEETVEVLQYLDSLTNVVLVRGNHEDLLEEVWYRGYYLGHDNKNGTKKTIQTIFHKYTDVAPYTPIEVSEKVLRPFLNKFVDYYESASYIFCHSWLPCKVHFDGEGEFWPWFIRNKTYEYRPDWREANEVEWQEARWGNPFRMAEASLNQTGKVICTGHWHCSAGWAMEEGRSEFGEDAKWDIYTDSAHGVIFLDKCTAHTGEVNVVVIEDDLLPAEAFTNETV